MTRWLLLPIDLVLVALAWVLAFWLRFNLDVPPEFTDMAWDALPWPLVAYAVGLFGAGVYRHLWRYTSLADLARLVAGVALCGLLAAAVVLMLRIPSFPRSVLLLHPMLALLSVAAVRAAVRLAFARSTTKPGGKPLLVAGSLADAAGVLPTLRGLSLWTPVGIVSPEPGERGRSLQGLRVMGELAELPSIARRTGAMAVLAASAPGSSTRRLALTAATDADLPLLTLPRADEWLHSDASHPRRIELEDLLGRPAVQLDIAGLADMLSGQTVMVTGAGGSIGSELCRQIARLGAARLVCVDVSEFAIYQLEQELMQSHPQLRGIYYTANVREPERLRAVAARHKPSVVFHAAAYKHVPLMEQLNEVEALRTNVLGTLNAARMAGACGARRFVMISTDKAVNPTNVMGASKRLAELVVQAVAREYPQTQYVSVRFGNVLGSSGSVVPLFSRQVARGGPVTVTHPEIVRYFMTIPEAAQLVLQAGQMGRSGQIFVLDMGEPVKIVELARMLIRLSGKTEEEVPITFTGLRPGEKLYEELLANDETTEPTPHPKLRVAKAAQHGLVLEAVQQWIEAAGPAPAEDAVRGWLRDQVPKYQPR